MDHLVRILFVSDGRMTREIRKFGNSHPMIRWTVKCPSWRAKADSNGCATGQLDQTTINIATEIFPSVTSPTSQPAVHIPGEWVPSANKTMPAPMIHCDGTDFWLCGQYQIHSPQDRLDPLHQVRSSESSVSKHTIDKPVVPAYVGLYPLPEPGVYERYHDMGTF